MILFNVNKSTGHPYPPPIVTNSVDEVTEGPHPVVFESITGDIIRHTSLRTDGSAGPSGLDTLALETSLQLTLAML